MGLNPPSSGRFNGGTITDVLAVEPTTQGVSQHALSVTSSNGYIAELYDDSEVFGVVIGNGGIYLHGSHEGNHSPLLRLQQWTGSADVDFFVVDPDGLIALTTMPLGVGPSGKVYMGALPTADPHVVGQLWNSSGTVKVSAG